MKYRGKLEFTTPEGNIYIRINKKITTKARYIVQQILGRQLHKYEKVFFKKEKNNFLLDNLVLMNFSNKTQTTFDMSDVDEWLITSIPTWSRLYEVCISCNLNTKKYAGRGLCINCYMKTYLKDS
jgi:hypothetical protein